MAIDALHDYIRAMQDLYEDSELTAEQRFGWTAHLNKCRDLVNELEGWEVDMNLSGITCDKKT
jgi:hypothetical protein